MVYFYASDIWENNHTGEHTEQLTLGEMRGVLKQLIDRILSIHLMSYQYHLQTMEMPLCE